MGKDEIIMKKTNKLFTKIGTAIVGIAMAIGVGVAASSNRGFKEARADSYTIVFANNASSATAISSSTNASTVIAEAGRTYVESKPFTINSGNVYYGDTKTCIRLGKSGAESSLSIALAEAGKVTATTIVVNADNTGGNKNTGATLSVNGAEAQTTAANDPQNYSFTINAEITSITLAASASVRVYSITVNSGIQNTFSVTYSKNCSDTVSGMPSNHNGLADGANQVLSEDAPERYGYVFGGWAASAESNTPIANNTVTIDGADVTVYAIWNENHEIAGKFADNPYTVAQARAAIASGTANEKTGVYTKGTIYNIVSYNDEYHSITYWISDTGFGSTSNKDGVQVYGGLNNENEDPFTSKDDLSVGDYVVVKGNLQNYSGTSQYNTNSRIISRTERSFVSLEVAHQPDKTSYSESEEFDPTGLVVNATYSAAPTTIDVTDLVEWPALTVGMTSIQGTINQNGTEIKTPEITISVSADELDHIVVDGSLTKTKYRDTDERFSADGLTVEAYYVSGNHIDVTEEVSWSFSPEFALGVISVVATATYDGKTASSSAQAVTVVTAPNAELLPADFKSGSYAANNEDGVTSSIGNIHFACFDTYKNSDYIQVRKTKDSDKGYFYNDTAPLGARITKIVVPVVTNSITVYLGTSALEDAQAGENENSYTFDSTHDEYIVDGDFTYVRFETGENYCQLEAVSIWFETNTPEISVSPTSFSFEQTNEGNVEVTITKQYFGEQEVTYEASSSDTSVVANNVIQIENSVVKIAKSNINVGSTTITVVAKVGDVEKARATFSVVCSAHNRSFVSYAIKTEATNKVFDAGDKFDVTGLVVEGTFDAEPTKEDITAQCTYKLVDASGRVSDLVPGTTVLSGGTYSVKIVYGTNETLSYQIKVLTIASIAVKTQPAKTNYRIGEAFDPTGLVLEGTKSDGTSKVDITEGFTCSTLDSKTAGQKTITITYNGLTTTLKVTVVENVYYSQIKVASDLKAGDKLLLVAVKDDVSKIASGVSGNNKFIDATDVKIEDGKILQTDAIQSYELTLGGEVGAWTLANSQGKLLGVTTAKGANLALVDASSETKHTWTITINDGVVEIKINGIDGGSLQYNKDNPRFTNYTTTQVAPQLYKVGAVEPTPSEKTLESINIATEQMKTTYNVGEQLDTTGLVVTAKYSDGSTEKVTDYTLSQPDMSTAGTKTITVTYQGKTATFTIKVNDSTQPAEDVAGAKTAAIEELRQYMQALLDSGEYDTTGRQELGQEYDKGIVLINSATTIAEVNTALTNAKALLDAVGKQGTDKTLSSIAVTTNPTKTTYNVGEQADYAGLVVTATYSDGSTEVIALASLTITGFSSQEAGTVTVTVTYNGKSATFTVTIIDSSDPLAEAKANAIAELEALVNGLNRADYSDEAWAQIQSALAEARTAINNATDAAALNTLVNNAKNVINAVKGNLDLAKAAALEALEQYYNSFDKNNYDEAGVASLNRAYNDGKDAIEAATSTDAVAAALANAKAAMDAVQTKPAEQPRKRCGGDIAATSIILSAIALAGVGLLVFKKRKED